MRIQLTKPLFAWDCLEDSPSLKTIREFLEAIPDASLLPAVPPPCPHVHPSPPTLGATTEPARHTGWGEVNPHASIAGGIRSTARRRYRALAIF